MLLFSNCLRPEERKKGFTAIIDRCSDKWTSVKLVLDRLQVNEKK